PLAVARSGAAAAKHLAPNSPKDAKSQPDIAVELRIKAGSGGSVATVPATPLLSELAAKWMYILRNRSRWAADEDLKLEINQTAKTDLGRLGVAEDAVIAICNAP